MLYVIEDDIVTGNYDVFCHQVNCKGVMGAGIAKQIRSRYPEVYREYMSGRKVLGEIGIVRTHDDRICVNMFAQDGYGRDRRYTDYEAFEKCLLRLQRFLSESHRDWKLAFPYKIGCGLAGGDWRVVSKMLQDFSATVPQDVYICERR